MENKLSPLTTQEIIRSGNIKAIEGKANRTFWDLSSFFVLAKPEMQGYEPNFNLELAQYIYCVILIENKKQRMDQASFFKGNTILDRLISKVDLVTQYSNDYRTIKNGIDRQLSDVQEWIAFIDWLNDQFNESSSNRISLKQAVDYRNKFQESPYDVKLLWGFRNYQEIVDYIKRSLYN